MPGPIKTVTLEISSWRGISIGAQHYYGKLIFDDAEGKYQRVELLRTLDDAGATKLMKQQNDGRNPDYWIEYFAGDRTDCFDTKIELRNLAKKEWKKLCPDAKLLICGSSCCADPQEVLAADDPELMKQINYLWALAEEIDYYEKDEKAMTKIYKAYQKLLKENS